MKKYRIIKGGRLDKLLTHKTAIGLLAASSIILVGMSAATAAFATDDQPRQLNTIEPMAWERPAETLIDLGEFTITHYCPCETCCGVWALNRPDGIIYTASGAEAEAGKTIAVDPAIIPYGTEVIIDGHAYIAQDSGSAVKGNHIDIYCTTHEEALELGSYKINVYREEKSNA